MTREDWDRLWGVVYEREVVQGMTPNAAIFQADEEMISKWGDRPKEKQG